MRMSTIAPHPTKKNPFFSSSSQIRQLEEDNKRKGDVMAEVKVLLRQAAEREKGQLEEIEGLKKRVRDMLDRDNEKKEKG